MSLLEAIFAPTWVEGLPLLVRPTDPFVHRLAREPDRLYSSIRAQLDGAWNEIPPASRSNVLLGLLRSRQDVQHERARDVLFAGVGLQRTGWNVDWEVRSADGKTPDFRLRKGGIEVLAEAVTPDVEGPFADAKDTQRFVAALSGLSSNYGIWVRDLAVGKNADLAAIRAHFEEVIATADDANVNGRYSSDDAEIGYRLERIERVTTSPYLGTEAIMFWGAVGRDELRASIVKKIRKYRRPMIVITGVPTGSTPDFVALDEAMYGSEFVTFRAGCSETTSGRGGGLMIEDGEDGDLIREYLVGVLGVRLEMPIGTNRYRLRMHLFHAQEQQEALADAFLPIPQTVLRPNGANVAPAPVGDSTWSCLPGVIP